MACKLDVFTVATEPAAVAKKGGGFLLLHSRVTKKGRPVYSSTEMLYCLSSNYLYKARDFTYRV